MLQFEPWKKILVLIICLFGLLYASPNLLSENILPSKSESWLPSKRVSLGLDLQGGSHLLVEVKTGKVMQERTKDLIDTARAALREDKIGYSGGIKAKEHGFSIQLRDLSQRELAYKILSTMNADLKVETTDDGLVLVEMTEQSVKDTKSKIVGQAIEVIRKRVDETGTKEPVIQRQGSERIIIQLPGVEDPSYIKELLGKTAAMSFHLTDTKTSMDRAMSGKIPSGSRIVKHIDPEMGSILIRRRAVLTGKSLIDSRPQFDQGRPVVGFKFDGIGAKKFCKITRENEGKPFAIVLDNEVITAPRINGAICGGQGVITGSFSVQEANDLSLLLRSGALPADIEFVEERSVGPSLGADSVEAGKRASLVGMCLILIFMLTSYRMFGLLANVALLVNMALIFAILSTLQATLTLPGIAGIVLTIGMAVDANVLIFERIREELRAGRSNYSAVDAGYKQALSTIIDANITTLIAAVLLYSFGTGPIRGFAVTLGVGILTSMFSSIMFTRMMVVIWLRNNKSKALPI